MTIYEADWVCPISSPPIRNGRLVVENGRIQEKSEGMNVIRFPGCAIIPGFVNAHAHLELTILRGFLDDLPFVDWVSRLTRTKYEVLSRDDILVSARLGALEMLQAGVTCVAEVMDLGAGWQAMRELSLQGVAYQEVFGPAPQQADEALAGLKRKVESYRQDEATTMKVGLSPHAPFTVSSMLYASVNDYALRERLPMTTHIAESPEEGMFVRWGAGVFAERWAARGIPVQPPGCTPLAYLNDLGMLRPETLLVHAIDVEDSDLALLSEKRPTIVHCPKSNAKLAHGIARIADIRRAGVCVGLGTDSVASNNVVDMFEEMRAAVFQQRLRTQKLDSLHAHTVFHMATLGGAQCLGLQNHLGSLDAGKRADFVVVDLNDLAVQPVHDPIESMVYSASRQNVRATFIGGREVSLDATELLREFVRVSERLRGT
jgi:cytosine/adenosine deaminase-related metal-dependent hydrolase